MNIERVKEHTFREFHKLHQTRNDWLDTIPYQIADAFVENPYMEVLHDQINLLMSSVYTQEEQEAIEWFLCEWEENNSLEWIVDGVEYRFKDIDDYIEFLNNYFRWKEKNT